MSYLQLRADTEDEAARQAETLRQRIYTARKHVVSEPAQKQALVQAFNDGQAIGQAESIQSHFTADNFASRRTTGHNAYDPESLLTGAEIEAGLGYGDLRVYTSQTVYDAIVSGEIPVDLIPRLAPRQRQTQKKEEQKNEN